MMYTQETCFGFTQARDSGQLYFPENRDHETYLCILDYLKHHCDRIVISDMRYPAYITSLPDLKNRLSPWFIERRKTDHGARSSDKDGIEQIAYFDDHHYRCCGESVNLLRSYENFTTIDSTLDIRFYAGDRCVLTTIGHEYLYYLDPEFFLALPELQLTEEKLGEAVCTNRDTASAAALPYLMPPLSHDEYRILLADLGRYSDTLSLILPEHPSPAAQTLMQELTPFLLRHTTIRNWPGRWHIDVPADEYLYSVNKETIAVLQKLKNFFDIDTDLSFNRSGFSILYVLRQEEQCVLDAEFFESAGPSPSLSHPERRAYRRYINDYDQALSEGHLYSLIDQSRSTYHSFLDKLLDRCDKFTLVTRGSVSTTPLAGILEAYQLRADPPTGYPAVENFFELRFTEYRCCPESVAILKDRSSFFDLGENTSIVFRRHSKCVLYTIAEEQLCVIDLWTLGIPQPGIKMWPEICINKGRISETTAYLIMGCAGCASRAEWEQCLLTAGHSWEPYIPPEQQN